MTDSTLATLEALSNFAPIVDSDTAAIIKADTPIYGLSELSSGVTDIIGKTALQEALAGKEVDLKEAALYSALGGLFGGVTEGLGDVFAAEKADKYRKTLAALQTGDESNSEGLAPGLFGRARDTIELFRQKQKDELNQRAAKINDEVLTDRLKGDEELKRDLQKSLFDAALDDPAKVKLFLQEHPRVKSEIFNEPVSKRAEEKPSGVPLDVASGGVKSAPETITAKPVSGGNRLEQLINEYQSVPEARSALREEQKAEKDLQIANVKDFDKYLIDKRDEISQAKSQVQDLASTLSITGETGGITGEETARGAKLQFQRFFGSDEAANRIAARGDLQSQAVIAASQIKRLFKDSQQSGKEFENYLAAVPGLDKTDDTNKRLLDRMARGVDAGEERLRFLEKAKADGYSLADGLAAYEELESKLPLFIREGSDLAINPLRAGIDIGEISISDVKGFNPQNIQKKKEVVAAREPTEQVSEAGPSPDASTDYAAMARAALIGPARYGESALFGIPSRLVAGGKTIAGEVGEFFGGEEIPFRERAGKDLEEVRGSVDAAAKESPVISGVGDIAGIFGSPVNYLKPVQALYKTKGLVGVGARAAGTAGLSVAQDIGEGKTEDLGDKAVNAALFSAGVDALSGTLGKARKPAEKVFERLTGITAVDARRAAKGVAKKYVQEARQSFTRALGILKNEQGIRVRDLARSDEFVLGDLVDKSIKAIEKRNTEIDNIVAAADDAMARSGTAARLTTKQRAAAIDNAASVDKEAVAKEAAEITNSFGQRLLGKQVKLSDLQKEKKALNRTYKPGQSFQDAKTAVTDDFRTSIEKTVNNLVQQKKLPAVYADRIRKLNLEERDLMRLRDAYINKLPGAQAEDILSSIQRGGFTTGGASIQGARNVGSIAGEAGEKAAMAAAAIAYSKRIGRPISYVLSSGGAQEFINSPEFRNAATEAIKETSSSGGEPLDFRSSYKDEAKTDSDEGEEPITKSNILWKPASANDGKLVVLFPKAVGNITIRDAETGKVLDTGRSAGPSNGYGDTVRFNKPGSAFRNVVIEDGDGNELFVEDGSRRDENLASKRGLAQQKKTQKKTEAELPGIGSVVKMKDKNVDKNQEELIRQAAREEGISPKVLRALVQVESKGNPDAVGYETPETKRQGARAIGLGQLMPKTARAQAAKMGIEEPNLKDPVTNLKISANYLKELLDRFDGDLELALTAYHSGPTRVSALLKETGGDSLSDIINKLGPEGKKYAQKVLAKV